MELMMHLGVDDAFADLWREIEVLRVLCNGLKARLTALEANNGSLRPQAARSRRFDPETHKEVQHDN